MTSVLPSAEPRAPRHAVAAKEALPDADVLFVNLAPRGSTVPDPPNLRLNGGVKRVTIEYPCRQRGLLAVACRKLAVKVSRLLMRSTGLVTEAVFGDRVIGLTRRLRELNCDVYFAHNIETLLPAARAAQKCGAQLIFDCMEYYSDMGGGQTRDEARAASSLERLWLPKCCLVTASSDSLATVLSKEYEIVQPLALYNTPRMVDDVPAKPKSGLRLYWRNSVIGFGQRGLEDALAALTKLPGDITLSVQGNLGTDGGLALRDRICRYGLVQRVTVLPAYEPGDAVLQAARHSVGLCLERREPANHKYTVSNKIFDYMMGGLAVVAADLPGLRSVVTQAGCGLLFEPGSPQHLAQQIARLYAEPETLARFGADGRKFARRTGNIAVDMERLKVALQSIARKAT